jgi:hypothetical protein
MAGRRIDDHGGYPASSDAAMKSKNRLSHETSAEGAGHMAPGYYPDTTEHIHKDQEHGVSKLKGRPLKSGYRN